MRGLVFVMCMFVVSVFTALAAPIATFASSQRVEPGSALLSTGNDISWPQCKAINSLPSSNAFAVVGVNNGTPNTSNPCFASELAWANKSSGINGQPQVSLYVNTANPGDTMPANVNWPNSDYDTTEPGLPDINPYGKCYGSDDLSCAWQYGYNMANLDVHVRSVPAPSTYRWYLDVETANSWSADTARNAADLEGMVAYFRGIGVNVVVYSTYRQWGLIVGRDYDQKNDADGNALDGLPSWVPGAGSAADAKSNCKLHTFTKGGTVTLSQYLTPHADLDADVPCS